MTGGGLLFFPSPSKKAPAGASSIYGVSLPPESINPSDPRDTTQFYTYFRINSSDIDMGYMNNASQYDKLADFLFDLLHRGNSVIDSIVVVGSSSPEGNMARNKRLSSARHSSLYSYLLQKFPMVDSLKILALDKGENWDGLLSLVESDPKVPNRDDVLGILKMSSSRSTREYFLRALNFGLPWRYIRKNMLPLLRSGSVINVYSRRSVVADSSFVSVVDSLSTDSELDDTSTSFLPITPPPALQTLALDSTLLAVDTVFRTRFVGERIEPVLTAGRPLWSLKTNLLYWGLLQPNVEVEFYFGRHWSFNFEYQIAWWKDRSKHQYYQYTHCGPEGRYWFKGDNKFKGHYVGVHVGFGIYDLSLGLENQQYEGCQGEFAIALGISYGYVWQLGKILHLEAGFGFGYVMTEYRRYRYIDQCYVYQATERMQFLGPTKARVALQWRIGTGIFGGKKGAVR